MLQHFSNVTVWFEALILQARIDRTSHGSPSFISCSKTLQHELNFNSVPGDIQGTCTSASLMAKPQRCSKSLGLLKYLAAAHPKASPRYLMKNQCKHKPLCSPTQQIRLENFNIIDVFFYCYFYMWILLLLHVNHQAGKQAMGALIHNLNFGSMFPCQSLKLHMATHILIQNFKLILINITYKQR